MQPRVPVALAALLGLAVWASVSAPSAQAFRALGMFPYNGRSHNIMLQALMEVLADRGHDVVMFSPYPQKKPRANYTDVDLSKEFPSMFNSMPVDFTQSYSGLTIIDLIAHLAGPNYCRKVFETQQFKDLMAGKYGKFDVVFTEIFGSDCLVAVAHKMKLPLISVVTAPDFAWMHERVGSVDNPSYIVTNNVPMVGRLSFWQRVQNVLAYVECHFKHKWVVQEPSDAVVREFLGDDMPTIAEMVRNTSLILVNRHVSVNPARPVAPNVVHVGGLHLKGVSNKRTAAGLEPGLRRWMDDAEHGVILFTLGSLVPTSSMPKALVQGMLRAFAALPQRVLWKYERDDLELPANVRTASWVSQRDVLAHPKTVLFMTHGGLMGTTEALMLGVPMLGIPLFADQQPNVALYQHLGIAELLPYADLSEANVLALVKQLTETDRYRVRAKEVAERFADRPRSAAEEAAWWSEYVVRHGGAPHLRPLGADMPLYQYLLLDVAALSLGLLVFGVLLLRAIFRMLLCRGTTRTPSKVKRN